MQILMAFLDVEFWASAFRLSIPLLLGALGGLMCERSGVVNVFIEGILVIGAFTASLFALWLGGPWYGVMMAGIFGALSGLILAWLTVTLKANQIVVGISLNIVAVGLTNFLFVVLLYRPGVVSRTAPFTLIRIPGLSEFPVVGRLFFHQHPLLYLAVIATILVYIFLYRTHQGLIVRSVGESAKVANALGVSPDLFRYISVVVGGALIGMGGSYLSLVEITTYQPGTVAGRGFIAYAAMIFGRWNPFGVLGAVLFFGAANALQFRIQGMNLPLPQLLPNMLPYILTLVALTAFGKTSPPADLGKPFVLESHND